MITRALATHTVLWEAETFAADFARANSKGGWWDLSCWEMVQIAGPDAWDYLNRMTTLNFRKWEVGQVAPGAFLTGKAVPLLWGYFLKSSAENFLFLVPPGQGELAYETIEKFHFLENLTVSQVSEQWKVFGWWNWSDSWKELGAAGPHSGMAFSSTAGWSFADPFRPNLGWAWVPSSEAHGFALNLKKHLGEPLGYRLFEFFRIEAGVVWIGKETGEKTLALEAGLDRSISEQKGCYPGQEVVERIRTYGRVNRRLARVTIEPIAEWQLPADLQDAEGKPAGSLFAAEVLPEAPTKAYGMAYVNRIFLDQPDVPLFVVGAGVAEKSVQVRLRDAATWTP